MVAPASHTPFDSIKEKTYQRENAATVPLRPHLEKFEIQATARANGGPDQVTAAASVVVVNLLAHVSAAFSVGWGGAASQGRQ
jgi:hypothetical protein